MKRLVTCATFVAAVTACSATPQLAETSEAYQRWQQREQSLAQIAAWSVEGRIAVNLEDEGWNGSITWTQLNEGFEIEIRSPLGGAIAHLQGSPQSAVLKISDQESYTGSDAQALLASQFGWTLPVNELQRWIVGRPDNRAYDKLDLDAQGRVVNLRQSGWDIEFRRYTATGQHDLPDKLFARNDHMQVRVVIEQWNIP